MNCSSFWNRDSCWVEARIGRRTWENYPSNCAHLGIHLCLLCQFSWFQTRSELKRFRETWQGPTNQLSKIWCGQFMGSSTGTLSRSLSVGTPDDAYDFCCGFRNGYFWGPFSGGFRLTFPSWDFTCWHTHMSFIIFIDLYVSLSSRKILSCNLRQKQADLSRLVAISCGSN